MVQIFIAKTPSGPRFFWNLGANVGVASPNIREDVQLVQFAFHVTQ